MTIETAIINFKLAMFEKPFEAWPELAYHSQEAFQMAQRQLGDLVLAARKAGYTIRHSGAENRKEKTAWNRISFGARVLTIRYAAAPVRVVNVRDTSREAYHTVDFSTALGRVAAAIMANPDSLRGEIAQMLDMEKSTCTARIADLLKAPVTLNGVDYILTEGDKRKSMESGVSGHTLRFVKYEPNPTPVQVSLF